MGSKLIWIAAAFAFGAVCAAIFTMLRRRVGAKHTGRRLAISFVCYSILGLCIFYALWRLFSL